MTIIQQIKEILEKQRNCEGCLEDSPACHTCDVCGKRAKRVLIAMVEWLENNPETDIDAATLLTLRNMTHFTL